MIITLILYLKSKYYKLVFLQTVISKTALDFFKESFSIGDDNLFSEKTMNLY